MNSFWRMVARCALALVILPGIAGSTSGLGGVRAQDAARPKNDRVLGWTEGAWRARPA